MRRTLIAVLLGVLALSGCADMQRSLDALNTGKPATSPTRTAPATSAPAPASGGVGAGAPNRTGCTVSVATMAQLSAALRPGAKVCVTTDNLSGKLSITKSGTAAAAITVVGTGRTAVAGISVRASYVTVDGFTAVGASAPAMELTGDHVIARNNTIRDPRGGDGDGIRFYGDNISILNNTVSGTSNSNGHADCMQTFTSGRPSSLNARIEANRCEKIANICLMAEGPGDVGDGGGGDGTSANWTFSRNYCEFGAAQGVMIEAIQNVKITNNTFKGRSKAIGLDIGATGAVVSGNTLIGFSCEVGMDSSSRKGYQGPAPCSGP